MDQKNEQKAPLRIKDLAELKRCIRPGTELVATSHSKHPALVGLVRVVTEVQTNAYYSVVKDQPTHQYSTCNYGKGFRSDFEKASNYLFEGTTIKVILFLSANIKTSLISFLRKMKRILRLS